MPRDLVVDDAVLEILAEQAPLTVVRGPRGYGKSATLNAWLSASPPEHQVVRVALSREANDAEEFWRILDGELTQAGVLDGEPAADHRTRVVLALARRSEPLTVVIDDYHHAGRLETAADIDDELVELVRQNDQLYLVVASRTTRAIETSGSLSVDVALVSPRELKLRAPEVLGLAGRLGVPLNEREAERLATGFAGWPAAIRDVLVRSRGEGGKINLALADDYIASMVRDLRHEQVRTFLLRTAVPDCFDAELAELVSPGDSTLTILRNVRAAGLLGEEIVGERRVYSYAPIVRQALVRMLAESRPDELREVHRALMTRCLHKRDHVAALVHAIHAGAWTTAEQVMEDEWHHLVTQEPAVLMAAARLIPPDIVAERPRFQVARDEVDGALTTGRPGRDLIWPTGDIRGLTAEIGPTALRNGMGATTFALLQWGVAAVLAGDESSALYAFGRARTVAQEAGEGPAAVALATLGLAGTHAIYGDVTIAASWLRDESLRTPEERPPELAGYVAYWERLIRALVALDRLDPDAGHLVAAMLERTRRDEIWGLEVMVHAVSAAVSGEPGDIARWAANVRAARHYLPQGRMAEMVLRATEVEVLLVGGLFDDARHVARNLPVNAVSMSTHARLALAGGEYRQAATRAREALEHPALSQRSVMECQLVLAAAHHALGERAAARAAFAEAVRTAYASGQRRPLLVLRHSVFTALAAGDQRVLGLWPEVYRPSERETAEEPRGGLTELLTPRELEVLQALHQHTGAVPIAEVLGLSVNTVKSHLRSVYHKLGVTNRSGALRRADELDRAGPPGHVGTG
ncbi:ATP/maltotriose-dependent transcriptional regulator MalT [Georgenia soli]|uniref:ATP/maltotriose-dependent transcriptional regulator MalT n=1 Tax=Georgenia soli TaxID=638953 RepID=A0A2A9EQF8_9MICO|nr:LuxR C-terminal-related transcriptional regulator [Georgenia soli]PFG40439.1 ATP/maltotriose-dependent transcriptional regulator MalT [Georgenia soli]